MSAAWRSAAKVTVASAGSGLTRSFLRDREARRSVGDVRRFLRPGLAVPRAGWPALMSDTSAITHKPTKTQPAIRAATRPLLAPMNSHRALLAPPGTLPSTVPERPVRDP